MCEQPTDQPSDRVRRVEETVGFLEHTTEQLSGEILELNRGLAEACRRLEVIERRFEALAHAADGDHAARPAEGGDASDQQA